MVVTLALLLAQAAPAAAQTPPPAAVAATPSAPDRAYMVPAPGGRVYVRVNGNVHGPRPPVIFIHGGPGGTHRSHVAMLPLSDERAVILFDQHDTGASDRVGDRRQWTVPVLMGALEAIRQHLNIDRWHVVGGSWGGTMALEYGAAYPDRIVSLTLASPLISTRSWIADAMIWRSQLPASTQKILTACEGRRPPPKERCDAAEAEFSARHLRREPVSPVIAAYRAPGAGNRDMYRHMWGPTEFTATGTLKNYDGEPLLARLPGDRTLFLTGQYDEARPETVLRFARRVKGAEMAVIPGAAHAVGNDRPDELIAVLRAFFRRKER